MDALITTPANVMLGAGIEAIYSGVDWISCSLPMGSEHEANWCNLGVHIINTIAEEGYDLEAFTRNGYDGLGAGGCFFGSRHDGSYLQLSGHYSGRFLDAIHRDDLHIARLDIQATVRYRVEAPNVGREIYREFVDANEALQPTRRRRLWYMKGYDGGWSTYIGSPSSEQRAVVYNKAIQSEQPEYVRCWRWEVRYKNAYATALYPQVIAEVEGRPMLCAGIVASWFSLRGSPPEWSPYVRIIAQPLIKEIPSDAEKRLRWLNEQVRPAVHWLMSKGYRSEVYAALELGSDDTAIPLPIQEPGGDKIDA